MRLREPPRGVYASLSPTPHGAGLGGSTVVRETATNRGKRGNRSGILRGFKGVLLAVAAGPPHIAALWRRQRGHKGGDLDKDGGIVMMAMKVDRDDGDVVVAAAFSPEKVRVHRENPPEKMEDRRKRWRSPENISGGGRRQWLLSEKERRGKGDDSASRKERQPIRNLQTQIKHHENVEFRSTMRTVGNANKCLLTVLHFSVKKQKINALTAENAKLKTKLSGNKSSGSTASEKPKVLSLGMYTNSSKYVPPPKRANWVKPTPLPKKKQVTFQEPPRTSNRPTQKPPVQQNKKPNVLVNLSTRTKPATESRKPMPKSHTSDHRILPIKV
ncbi:hypothetical protein Tco_0710897 [Tanacetum coccineum]